MEVQSFTADSVAEAVAQIRTELGPDAVALHVRPLPVPGMARLWRKPRIEVIAYVPEPESPKETALDGLSELRSQLDALQSRLDEPAGREPGLPQSSASARSDFLFDPAERLATDTDGWHLQTLFQGMGLLPVFAQRLKDEICQRHGDTAPDSIKQELDWATDALRRHWRYAPNTPATRTHIFIGAPGVGKSTLLCKRMARRVLVENRAARVLQLDGRTANPNGLVNLYGDILGVPVERFFQGPVNSGTDEVLFVDLPGVDWNDADALLELRRKLDFFENAEVHLVLNGAYEVSTLLAQTRAFSAWPITDLAITHLDEEKRWAKMWNLVLGTNYTLRWLSAGQNIPGDLWEAGAEHLLQRKTPLKQGV